MVLSITCCLNSSPPTPTLQIPSSFSCTSSPLPITTQLPWSWRKRSVSGMACMIVVSAIGLSGGPGESYAQADAQAQSLGGLVETERQVGLIQWSQRRACPPWRANSLENYVPENLPRPFARRRSEAVALPRTAPDVGTSTRAISNCFSL